MDIAPLTLPLDIGNARITYRVSEGEARWPEEGRLYMVGIEVTYGCADSAAALALLAQLLPNDRSKESAP